ncbi:MAG TPA: type II toxin-antitoxin system Phd/YefM family antitoxin [Candidatus Saccharimonadales bacterium]|nr:type II toxin-antitoxin system Phd/YefM family antitoxin [Candidatus Saccharimonadales bacterium]
MKTINIYDAKTNLSKYIKQAKAGEAVYIGAYGEPEVKLVRVEKKAQPKRQLGAWKDNLNVMIPDDFDDIDPEIMAMFENSRIFPDGNV